MARRNDSRHLLHRARSRTGPAIPRRGSSAGAPPTDGPRSRAGAPPTGLHRRTARAWAHHRPRYCDKCTAKSPQPHLQQVGGRDACLSNQPNTSSRSTRRAAAKEQPVRAAARAVVAVSMRKCARVNLKAPCWSWRTKPTSRAESRPTLTCGPASFPSLRGISTTWTAWTCGSSTRMSGGWTGYRFRTVSQR